METKTFNIVLPQKLVQKIDQVAEEEYRNRSELIREALRFYLEERGNLTPVFVVDEKNWQRMKPLVKKVRKTLYRERYGK